MTFGPILPVKLWEPNPLFCRSAEKQKNNEKGNSYHFWVNLYTSGLFNIQ
jgi:hypothetical protein